MIRIKKMLAGMLLCAPAMVSVSGHADPVAPQVTLQQSVAPQGTALQAPLAGAPALPVTVTSAPAQQVVTGAADAQFMVTAKQFEATAVALGQQAAIWGKKSVVRTLAQTMIQEHTQANNELKQLAAAKGIQLPIALNDRQRLLVKQLYDLHRTHLMHYYVSAETGELQAAIAAYTQEAGQGQDREIKAFAMKELPVLQNDLAQMQAIR